MFEPVLAADVQAGQHEEENKSAALQPALRIVQSRIVCIYK